MSLKLKHDERKETDIGPASRDLDANKNCSSHDKGILDPNEGANLENFESQTARLSSRSQLHRYWSISIHQAKSSPFLRAIFPYTPTKEPGPPPDGGIIAWCQVLAAHLAIFNAWGYINSFGVFQTYYQVALDRSPSDVSWVGSIQIWLLFFIGAFSGRMTDAGYFATAFLIGSALQLLGLFLTSFATEYWHLLLAQGVCQGIGMGLAFCPQLALLATYFRKRRALALMLASSGTSTGGMVYPAMVECLLPRIGFAWTVRAIGFVMLVLQLVSLMLFKPRLPPRTTGPLIEITAFLEVPYVMFASGMFLIFWGLFFAFYYVGIFGSQVIGLSHEQSINMLLTMNGVGILSRAIPAMIADRYTGPLNLICLAGMVASLLLYCWIAVSSTAGLFSFSVVYGLFSATIMGLFPPTLSTLTDDLKKMGVRMGMVFSIVSFACLTGTPIAGVLIQRDGGGFLYAQIYAGSSVLLGTMLLVAARVVKVGWKLNVRA